MKTRVLGLGFLLGLMLHAMPAIAAPGRLDSAEFRSHSHNDYAQAQPLSTALVHHMGSVEADVWLIDGELRLGHDKAHTRPGWTLRSDYLAPLQARAAANGGKIYPAGPGLLLLIDLKSEGVATYAAVAKELADFAGLLTRYVDGRVQPGAVTVIITGNTPRAQLAGESRRFAACDGRPADLDLNPPVSLVPLVSDNWKLHFKWNGEGAIPPAEREKLRTFADRAHAQGRKFRLWGAPDNAAGWQVQFDAGVDLINTDHPAALQEFLRQR